MGERGGADEARLDLRVSDAERQAVVNVLHEQTNVGRLTLGEFEERLGEVYGARTAGDLRHALRELPVEPTPPSSAPAASDGVGAMTEAELKRRWRLRRRSDLGGLFVPNFICNFIWLMSGGHYWWPGWVLLGTGMGIVTTIAQGFDPHKERLALEAEQRKQAIEKIATRHFTDHDR